MLDERKMDVLRAIVEDYVSTNEPVGSKTLVERHRFGVSPATIRNDMAALEELGYIAQPYTSAGRVPTDRGYRMFVDRLSSVKPLSVAERRAIETFLAGAIDLDDVLGRTVRLLAQLTHQVAVVQYPLLTRSSIRHVELVPLAPMRVMFVLITNTGRVEQRVVDCPEPVSEDSVVDLRNTLNACLAGQWLADAATSVSSLPDHLPVEERSAAAALLSVILDTLVGGQEEKVVLGGTSNLTRFPIDFPESIRPVLEALEEQVVLMRLLGEATDPTTLTVRIGEENPHEGLRSAAVVSAGYGVGSQALARLGVLGPTRMDYPGTMGAVRAVARYVGQILAGS
ncbi:MAG: heat-inducible transcriptional repressor HrcA [Streptosporangiaceae bacterium]